MFGIGPEEIILVLVLALLVLGPERLPKVARDIGRVVGDLRRTSDELRDEFLNADRILEAPKPAATTGTPPPALAPPAVPGETAFEREMREARERLRET